ncbi:MULTISPECIES: RidA family protein [Achromobacter]|jgi:2-iminobutanoate/2-iminopropanoate deaminase|uniref:RidA family protein n=1 Tax=Achromobacter denitrificans TaxID=32002 RepID=A0A6N0JG18_ACHDE|nr:MULTISPECIES: RidA family protein [Achromobacter]MDF3849739.1 RidA family protein [Achromobacter denitrificans]MDF3849747.1 RidA family protein [Achromobacter denitrificans]MPT40109.1 RidA family protein [Achromobacter sp.]QKQ45977.1 RidA family protein [Achromobacter denitrificans]GFN29246.1 endoribonuclease [Achromobacter denitrificans]
MAKEIIRSDKVTPPLAPLSPAVRSNGFVFVSGQPAFFDDRQIAENDFDAQMHQVMANVKALLEAAGSSLDKIVKANVILKHASDFARMNEIYRSYFPDGNYPARTTIEASMGNPLFLLEIECTAEA